jgi:cytidyltransferase-like protein
VIEYSIDKTAVIIGRFQPMHVGHLALILNTMRKYPRTMVLIGSAGVVNAKNPIPTGVQIRLLLETLRTYAKPASVIPYGSVMVDCLADFEDKFYTWEDNLRTILGLEHKSPTEDCVIIGTYRFGDDPTRHYLETLKYLGWDVQLTQVFSDRSGSAIREAVRNDDRAIRGAGVPGNWHTIAEKCINHFSQSEEKFV